MKKKLVIFSSIFASILIIVMMLCYVFIWRIPSSTEVFNDLQSSVVEFKASSGESVVSYGSGVFIDNEGTILSNAHMVTYKQSGVYKEFNTFEIRFSFEKDYRSVSLVDYDLSLDISVLKLDNLSTANFKSINIGDSSKIHSGDKVYAVGNGMNHGIGITEGLVSLPIVNISYEEKIRSVIQCDLVINEGNSGGALVDERGKLIGITTFRLKDYSGNIIYGIAFCIPVNTVIEYLNS